MNAIFILWILGIAYFVFSIYFILSSRQSPCNEKILCSAIWYKETATAKYLPTNINKGVVICGHRHPHCIHTLVALTGKRSVTTEIGEYEQGFLTNLNRFVDRKEAFGIAESASQLNDRARGGARRLFSEDLY